MPTYVYECSKCDDELEVWQSFSEDPLKKHPGCGGKLTKVYQPVGIVLKGPGFYKTDSRNGKKSSSESGSSSDSGSESKSDSKSDSTKTDTKKTDSSGSSSKKADAAQTASSGSKSA
jgi:putative FmdB family regulatory protein